MAPVNLSASARAFVRLGLLLLFAAGMASVWHMMASQIPSSPWRADVLPGPVAQLRDGALVMGLVSIAFAWLMPLASTRGEPKKLVIVSHVGVLIMVLALAYGATQGMYGVQIDDPRPDSRILLLTRFFGAVLLVVCFAWLSVLVWRGLQSSHSKSSE